MTARCFCHELAHLDGHLYTELADRIYTTEELDGMLEEQERRMTIVFMGTPDFAVPSLEALVAAGHRCAACSASRTSRWAATRTSCSPPL